MHPELVEVVRLLEHDLLACGEVPFRFEEGELMDDERLALRLVIGPSADRLHWREAFVTAGLPLFERLHWLLPDLQQEVTEARADAGLWAYWPRCPEHPRTHPTISGGRHRPVAHWVCPWDDAIDLGTVGALTPEQAPSRRR